MQRLFFLSVNTSSHNTSGKCTHVFAGICFTIVHLRGKSIDILLIWLSVAMAAKLDCRAGFLTILLTSETLVRWMRSHEQPAKDQTYCACRRSLYGTVAFDHSEQSNWILKTYTSVFVLQWINMGINYFIRITEKIWTLIVLLDYMVPKTSWSIPETLKALWSYTFTCYKTIKAAVLTLPSQIIKW